MRTGDVSQGQDNDKIWWMKARSINNDINHEFCPSVCVLLTHSVYVNHLFLTE